MASVNDWRLELERQRAEEEREARARFGWQDLVGLLESAANIHMGYKGLKETGERTDLLRGTQDFNVQKSTMDALQGDRAGAWRRTADDFVGSPPRSEVPGPMGGMQFTESALQEWPEPPEVPGQTLTWQNPETGRPHYTLEHPEDEPFTGPWPAGPNVPGQVQTWTDPETGEPSYTRSHLPDAASGPGQMIDIPGTEYQMDINTSQGRQMVLEMWRAQNVGKNPFEAAEGRFKTLYPYGNPEIDSQAEMGLIAAEISAQNTIFALAPPDLFTDVLITGSDIAALDQMGLCWLDEGVDTATIEALESYIQVLKKRAGMGR